MSERPTDGQGAGSEAGVILQADFRAPAKETEVVHAGGYVPRCRHKRYVLDGTTRTVSCGDCEARLDPFQLLLEYADRERVWRNWDIAHQKAEERVRELEAEEKRIKARTRNASRKDADEAVAAERKRLAMRQVDIRQAARSLAGGVQALLHLLPEDGEVKRAPRRPKMVALNIRALDPQASFGGISYNPATYDGARAIQQHIAALEHELQRQRSEGR